MGSNVENTPANPTAAGFWVLLDPNQFPGVEAGALYVSGTTILQGDGTSVSVAYLYNPDTETFEEVTGPFTLSDYTVEPGSGIIRTINAVGAIPAGAILYLSEDLSDPFYAGIALLDSSGKVILSGGQIRTANAHTLQSLIEINYVREGNRLMESALSGLDKAVSATDRAISVLGDIQNLHNSLLVEALDPLEFQYWVKWGGALNSGSDYVWKQVVEIIGQDAFEVISNTSDLINAYTQAYNFYASAYFGLPIFPDFEYSSMNAEGFQTVFLNDFKNMRTELSNTISALVLVNGQDSSNTTTLAGKLKKVLDDMPTDAQITDPAQAYLNIKSWAMDYYRAYEGESYMQDDPAVGEPTRMIAVTLQVTARRDDGANQTQVPNVTQIVIYVQGAVQTLVTRVPDGSFTSRITVSQIDLGSLLPPGLHTEITLYTNLSNVVVGVQTVGEMGSQPVDPFYNSNYLRDASKAGSIQDNITFAITAAQSLNDSQKEQVRRYMYVFEEYYKSASSLLTAISQIIQKIAQGIRPS